MLDGRSLKVERRWRGDCRGVVGDAIDSIVDLRQLPVCLFVTLTAVPANEGDLGI